MTYSVPDTFNSVPAYFEYTTFSPSCTPGKLTPSTLALPLRIWASCVCAKCTQCSSLEGQDGRIEGCSARHEDPVHSPTLTALAVPAFSTCPCVGFFCALEGSRIPPRDFSSLTSTFTSTLSPTGATVLYCSKGTIIQQIHAGMCCVRPCGVDRLGIAATAGSKGCLKPRKFHCASAILGIATESSAGLTDLYYSFWKIIVDCPYLAGECGGCPDNNPSVHGIPLWEGDQALGLHPSQHGRSARTHHVLPALSCF